MFLEIPDSGEEEVDLAVQAAARAFPTWSTTTTRQTRSAMMMKIADLMEARIDELAAAESRGESCGGRAVEGEMGGGRQRK